MTTPITMMEWLGYSWLHTGVFSHSHSPPVQRRDTTPFKHSSASSASSVIFYLLKGFFFKNPNNNQNEI